ncbi:MAG: HesA/MoeB/ThiF family protein, partial [Candidatus Kariarchaeaceae archaeon]
MDHQFDERYSRHYPLRSIGKENQRKLKFRNVLVAGMGGLGTSSSELLASLGIGNLRIVDYDVVELSNLPRQKLYADADLSKAKVDVAEEKLVLRNPTINIDPHATRIDALSAPQLIDDVDAIVDGLDRFSTRKILHKASFDQKIPFIFAGATAELANIMTITHEKETPCLEC